MRIITGSLKGRNYAAPSGHKTHPMSDRIKVALFNTLEDLRGASVLDAYAGSGALSFESVSRGAHFVQAIEKDMNAFRTITENREKLGIAKTLLNITRANCFSWSQRNSDQKFEVVFCDPPYDQLNIEHIQQLITHLKSTGIMVLSYSGREVTPALNGVVVVDNRNYGDAAVAYYRPE